ncbi:hypothetical protein ACIBTV_25400 [Micromonospora sp. NPDC049366]|uniref:hypothetical protein n=1 Tax=Micromonospora sp. NPDC049366 TaxID=3364271 RepID=UPI0037B4CE0A
MTHTDPTAHVVPLVAPGTVTVTDAHTDPYLRLTTADGGSLGLPIDMHRALSRARRNTPIVVAVLAEAERLLRRHTGCVPAGQWAWTDSRRGSFAVGVAELPGLCEMCLHGCDCHRNSDGCGHLGCRAARGSELMNTCPGVSVLMGR